MGEPVDSFHSPGFEVKLRLSKSRCIEDNTFSLPSGPFHFITIPKNVHSIAQGANMKILKSAFCVLSVSFFVSRFIASGQDFSKTLTPQRNKPDLEILDFKIEELTHPHNVRRDLTGSSINSPIRAEDTSDPTSINQRTSEGGAGTRRVYWAAIVVRNSGEKVIKAIHWDYAVSPLLDNEPVRRYDIFSKVKIWPGRSKTVRQVIPSEVSIDACQKVLFARVDANGKVEPDVKGGCVGSTGPVDWQDRRVVINRIEFADGSVWRRQ